MDNPQTHAGKPPALIGWRMLGLLYDLWPVLALWMLLGAAFTIGYTLAGHASRDNISPFSALQILLWLTCWAVTAGYAVLSWRRGGQTLGMRPWRIKVVGADGGVARWKALCMRFVVANVSLMVGGLGFWWAWIDREGLTWHDRASGTRLVRLPK